MFVVLTIKEGICYFEPAHIDKYTHVALICIEPVETESNETIQQVEIERDPDDAIDDIDSDITD